ncbi:sterol o-acyltransferase [Anaeramoeba flamelloides]|uniref:O-acyltransferase n=1 Tax=Anaeramoeba flamelloides TaxID=1746091 RepID=A0ABQ8XQX1_9EUKA|nr:sterol o-acyltransferase [Anaeramoeba flamelloides]
MNKKNWKTFEIYKEGLVYFTISLISILYNSFYSKECYTIEEKMTLATIFRFLRNFDYVLVYCLLSLQLSFLVYKIKKWYLEERISVRIFLLCHGIVSFLLVLIPVLRPEEFKNPYSRAALALFNSTLFLKFHGYLISFVCPIENHKLKSERKEEKNKKMASKEEKDQISIQATLKTRQQFRKEVLRSTTFSNLISFLISPTLIYSHDQGKKRPKKKKIRIKFIFFQSLATLSVAILMYLILKIGFSSIFNITNVNFFHLPQIVKCIGAQSCLLWILVSLLFQFALTIVAEITGYEDRNFFGFWTNSTNLDEFWKTWNIPVHLWSLQYIYLPCRKYIHLSRMSSAFMVFAVSAFFHEYVMFVVSGKLIWIVFVIFLLQPLLIMIGYMLSKKVRILFVRFIMYSVMFITLPGIEASYIIIMIKKKLFE